MKLISCAALSAVLLTAGTTMVEAATPAPVKPIVQTTCQEYLAMDETIKPKFIYFAEGHAKKGNPQAVLDVVGTDRIKPELDEYCRLNLTKSAYEHVMKTSMASDPVK